MTTLKVYEPTENHILAALSAYEFGLIASNLQLIETFKAEILLEATEKFRYVYFPIDTVVSLLCPMEDGSTVEVAAVGKEGMIGISAFLGSGGLTEAIVLTPGVCYRISKEIFRNMLMRSGGRRASNLQNALLQYTSSLFIEMIQTSACTRRHTLEQQVSRWLLTNFDRLDIDALPLTQETISIFLGVRRESVTEAAQKLKHAGAIDYQRGLIKLKDRNQLELKSCECYQIIKEKRFPHIHIEYPKNKMISGHLF